MKYYILYNPLASSGKCSRFVDKIELPQNSEKVLCDMTEYASYKEVLNIVLPEDTIVLCGGDGTLNRFVNSIGNTEIPNDILYFAAGSGNDFVNDLGLNKTNKPIKINEYIKNLPEVCVGDKTYKFVNGIGYGIDGYCCEEVNRLKALGKKTSYTLIALRGLLYAYKPTNAIVMVDSKEYRYKKVWLTPTMLGKFFGGGMAIAPTQNRLNPDGSLTTIVAHNLSKLKILTLFPTIFKGKHIKYKKYIEVFTGHNISVKFDIPTAMQIDGETVTGVKEYTVRTVASLLKK